MVMAMMWWWLFTSRNKRKERQSLSGRTSIHDPDLINLEKNNTK